MRTFTLTDLRKVLTTANFVIEPDFCSSLCTSDFADTEINDDYIDTKIYPKFISVQKIEISGIPLTVKKSIDVAVSISLDKLTGNVSSYIDEEYFYSLSSHEVTFEGDNIAIMSDDCEILTLPSDTPNIYIFSDSIHDHELSLNLPELTIDHAIKTIEDLISDSANAMYVKSQLEALI